MGKALSHNELAEDLAQHLAGYSTPMVIWTDMQLGPSGSARPDVYAIEKTYTALRARVFEVKVSRSDFLSDVTSGKYLRYAAFAGSISFATPAGLIAKDEVPKGCGLITRSNDGQWRYQRKPTQQKTPELPRETWLKLVIDGCSRARATVQAAKTSPKFHGEWQHQQRARKLAGQELASAIANRDNAIAKLREEQSEAETHHQRVIATRLATVNHEKEQLDKLRAEACAALGLAPDSTWWELRTELDARLTGDGLERVREAASTLVRLQDSLAKGRDALDRLIPVPTPPADAGMPSPQSP